MTGSPHARHVSESRTGHAAPGGGAASPGTLRHAFHAVQRLVAPPALSAHAGATALEYEYRFAPIAPIAPISPIPPIPPTPPGGVGQTSVPAETRAGTRTTARPIAGGEAHAEPRRPAAPLALSALDKQRFDSLYRDHFDFVYRNLRRLGVAQASLDDALQDVYLVVLRRIGDLQHDDHLKAWLFAIIFRVAGNHRRSARRRGCPESLNDLHLASGLPGPFDLTARAQASKFLHGFLGTLDDNRRAVFVMAELEQLTAPEIAEVLCANVNTVYSWLRAARGAFTKALRVARTNGGSDHG